MNLFSDTQLKTQNDLYKKYCNFKTLEELNNDLYLKY